MKPDGNEASHAGIALPNIVPVKEDQWESQKPAFDKYTALRIKHAGTDDTKDGAEGTDVYDFYVNVDNLYLKAEQKGSRSPQEVLTARFTYGMVLIGLGMIQDDGRAGHAVAIEAGGTSNGDNGGDNLEVRVGNATRAIAPVLLPMIDALGELGEDAVGAVGAGEES